MINGKELHISIKNQELKGIAKVDKSYSDYNFTFNQANGKLELTMISNDNNEKTIEVDLPTEELVKNVYYDNDNKEINIEWENGQTTKIPLSDLIDTYKADEVTLTLDNETKTFKIKESWIESLNNKIDNKVEKVNGKGLSTNDYTNSDKEKLDTLEETYASKEEVPTKLSQLEQDVDFGVSEEDVMDIIENNAEQTDTLDIGTSATYDATSDNQIPTTKAVQEMINVGGSSGGESVPLAVEITYAELKALRDSSNLVVGQQYRITDYQCTTTEPNTKSAGNQFDIIVVADSSNTLNENARAVQHDGDTYFAESNLSAWELKYDLDNDTTKYSWADEVNGKGVIYWLKDEWGNECPYDFKNIQFIRESVIDEDNGITFTNIYFYTFSAYEFLKSSGIQSDIQDASVLTKKESLDDYYNFCVCNIIKPYFNDTGSIEDPLNILNDIIFINRYSLEDQSYFMCYSNTFGNDCFNNTFGSLCYNTTFGYGCAYNIFGYGCTHNTFGNYCSYNTFGINCSLNTFGNECLHNNFGDNCYSTFGNNCSDNTFGNECYEITFVQDYCQYIIIENGCKHLEITCEDTDASNSNYLQNVHINMGVSGTSVDRRTITIPDRNLDYETTISTVEMQPKLTAGEGITIENNVISINYKNGDTEAY